MIKQFTVRDQRGCIAFHICEITPGVLRIADGKDQPDFIDREEIAGIIIKTYADTRARKKKNEALSHQKVTGHSS